MISRYINSIDVWNKLDIHTMNTIEEISFVGDGMDDFENRSSETTKECLESYIVYCKDQIEIAEKCLKKMVDNIN